MLHSTLAWLNVGLRHSCFSQELCFFRSELRFDGQDQYLSLKALVQLEKLRYICKLAIIGTGGPKNKLQNLKDFVAILSELELHECVEAKTLLLSVHGFSGTALWLTISMTSYSNTRDDIIIIFGMFIGLEPKFALV